MGRNLTFPIALAAVPVATLGAAALLWRAPTEAQASADPAVLRSTIADGRIRYQGARLPTIDLPDGGARPVKSLLDVKRRMRFGDFAWRDEGVPPGPLWIKVDLRNQLVSVFRGVHEIGTAVILYGAEDKPTPAGRFTVLAKLKDHQSSLYDAEMPYTLRLTGDGIAIHQSVVRPGTATHGCIGVPEGFAERLFDAAEVGNEVFIMTA